jgi:RNase P protein component
MKEKTIFDKIYNKELNLQFKNLTKKSVVEKEKVNSLKTVREEENIKEASDAKLDAFLNLLYNSKELDEVKIPSEFEKKVLKEKVLRNRIKAENIRKSLLDLENEIINKVKNKTYILDISKSTNLKRASNDIFGGNKKQITFEDYLYLLELKEEIIVNEASDILGG